MLRRKEDMKAWQKKLIAEENLAVVEAPKEVKAEEIIKAVNAKEVKDDKPKKAPAKRKTSTKKTEKPKE